MEYFRCVTYTIGSSNSQAHSLLDESLYSHYRNYDPLRHSNDPSKLGCFPKAKSATYIFETWQAFNSNMNGTEPKVEPYVPSMLEVEER